MELRVLHYFLAIAREENFTRAAEQLHVTRETLYPKQSSYRINGGRHDS